MAKHIKILGRGDASLLSDPDAVRTFIKITIDKLGMRPLGEPTVHDVALDILKLGQEPFDDEGGISVQLVGYGTLSTSHLAIHTWPLRSEFHMDIYSCREFDMVALADFAGDFFRCKEMRTTDLSSACEW